MADLAKRDWLLLVLQGKPLDRIRLMKALFLIWHRSGRNILSFFEFIPYMYGPCSFDLYRELETAQRDQLISQAPHPVDRWAPYFLTPKGFKAAEEATDKSDLTTKLFVQQIAGEVASVGFRELLRRVYSEAPDFASHSVVEQLTNK